MSKVMYTTLEAGSWAAVATVTLASVAYESDKSGRRDASCTTPPTATWGHGGSQGLPGDGNYIYVSLSMNGGAYVPSGRGEVSLWCSHQNGGCADAAQIMLMKVDGFS